MLHMKYLREHSDSEQDQILKAQLFYLTCLFFFFLESLFLKDTEWVKIKYFNCSNCKEGMMLTQLG